MQNPQDIHRIIHSYPHFSTTKLWKSAKTAFSDKNGIFLKGLFIFCGKFPKWAFYPLFKKIFLVENFFYSPLDMWKTILTFSTAY